MDMTSADTDIQARWKALEEQFPRQQVLRIGDIARRGLPRLGVNYVLQAMEGPSRVTESTYRSTSGRYPTKKLMSTVGFDSGSLELSCFMHMERDRAIVAFFDQAPPLAMRVRDTHGRLRAWYQRPDVLAIREDGAVVIVECKPLEVIRATNERRPGFYVWEDDHWRCPAAEAAARDLGMTYELRTEANFDPVMLRNVHFLETYLKRDTSMYAADICRLKARLAESAVLTIAEAREDICPDAIYCAIATGEVSADLQSSPVDKPTTFRIFRDESARLAFEVTVARQVRPAEDTKNAVPLKVGDEVLWHGEAWRCIHIDSDHILWMKGAVTQRCSIAAFLSLVSTGEIVVPQRNLLSDDACVAETIGRASVKDLATANERMELIRPHLEGANECAPNRSVRRYLQSYRAAEATHGYGYLGLLPKYNVNRRHGTRISDDVLAIVAAQFEKIYKSPERRSLKVLHGFIVDDCREKGLPSPCYSWLCDWANAQDKHEVERARKGHKGAYRYEPRVPVQAHAVHPRALRAFHRAHIDHTQIDLVTVDERGREKTTRLWLTVMICSHTRRVLAFVLIAEPPSYRSVLQVIRDCVRRHHRLPDVIVVDGGKELRSTWFQATCAFYHVTIHHRAKGKPRYGAEMERMFGTTNTELLHELVGNTQNTRNVRAMTEEVDPFKAAIWTAEEIKTLLEKFFFETYDTTVHSTLLRTPRQAFEASLREHGSQPHRLIPFDSKFLILTSPSTTKGTAKVQPDGVVINYLPYNHPTLRPHMHKSVPVRYDPFNLSVAWAQVNGEWLKLTSRHASELVNYTEHDVQVLTAAWRELRRNVKRERLNDRIVIALIKEAMAREAELTKSKARAAVPGRAAEDAPPEDDWMVDFDPDADVGDTASHPAESTPSRASFALFEDF